MPLDIGASILIVLGIAHLFHVHANLLLIATSIAFALAPDIDMFWYLFGKPSKQYDHRSYTHYPLLWVPVIALTYVMFGSLIGTLLLACVLMHLTHDTIGLGWGIAWLWPFSKRKIRFLSPTGSKNGGWEFFRTWSPQQELVMASVQHDPHWVRTYYLRPNIIGFIEYAVFLLGLGALFLYFL